MMQKRKSRGSGKREKFNGATLTLAFALVMQTGCTPSETYWFYDSPFELMEFDRVNQVRVEQGFEVVLPFPKSETSHWVMESLPVSGIHYSYGGTEDHRSFLRRWFADTRIEYFEFVAISPGRYQLVFKRVDGENNVLESRTVDIEVITP